MKRKIIIKTSVSLFVVVFGLLVFLFVTKTGLNLDKFREGKAVFHNFNFEIVDSLIKLESANNLLNKLFVFSDPNPETLIANTLDSITRKPRGFLAEKDYPVFPDWLAVDSIAGIKNYVLRFASNDGLKSFAGDSVYIPNFKQLYSVGVDSLIEKYHSFQNEFLSSLGFNGKILEFYLPTNSDEKNFEKITNRIKSEIYLLNENYQLSIINLRGKEISNDSIVAKKQINLLKDLVETGLCGVIFDNELNLELFDSLGFDGLYIFDTGSDEELEPKIIDLADVFIIHNSETISKLTSNIDKQLRITHRRQKAFKVLRAALWANQKQTTSFKSDYNIELWFRSNISKNSIILLKNTENLIPFSNINQKFLVINTTANNVFNFRDMFAKYANNTSFIEYDVNKQQTIKIPSGIDHVIVISNQTLENIPDEFISNLNENKSIVYVHSGHKLEIPLKRANVVIQIHEATDESLAYAAQLLFGGIPANGMVATNINDSISFGYKFITEKSRLEYTIPENAGLCSEKLLQIDTIMINAIVSRAFPGAQVLVAKEGKVIYNKSFGHHDYTRARQVKDDDLYDVASITKIAATTLAAMKLQEQNRLNISNETGRYFKDTTIDYSNIPADTIIFIDTLNISRVSKSELAKLILNKDTLHINDTIIRVKETAISRVTPNINIFKIPIRRLLVHQSGMNPSLPILPYISYRQTFNQHQKLISVPKQNLINKKEEESELDENVKNTDSLKRRLISPLTIANKVTPRNYFFSNKRIKDTAEVMVTESIYLRKQFSDSIFQNVKRLRIHSNARLQYACMNMILMQMVIDSITNTNMDVFLKRYFYTSLGMINTTFNPINSITKSRIIPTENDISWRKQLIHGTVHDPSAALLGGIAGNAGLFSTASDLAILGQIWLNGGSYGGKQYLSPSTLRTFTSKQPENHRGLGFDKPSDKGIHADSIPKSAFGHLGFTGCAMWIDPENEIIFIFLSNRIHPSVSNQIINTSKIRQRVHQAVYDAFLQ